jgi:hypothetical protein
MSSGRDTLLGVQEFNSGNTIVNASFSGVPNNGVTPVDIIMNKFHLIGNPTISY